MACPGRFCRRCCNASEELGLRMSTIAVPDIVGSQGRKSRWLVWVPVVGVLAAIAVVGGRKYVNTGPTGVAGTFQTVSRMDMDVKVSKDGELAAINNIDVNNLVEGSTTIQQMAKEGTFVKKGD